MRRLKLLASALGLVLSASSALGADCASTIYYQNGNYLKSGSTFYWPTGNYAVSGSTVYHPNGNYLRSGTTIYFENGNYFASGSTLYHPNGNYLRSGTTWYYANGNYQKSGSTFYHPNGNYARSGSTLYREDGSTTTFPLTLRNDLSGVGYIDWNVESSTDSQSWHLGTFSSTTGGTAAVSPDGSNGFKTTLKLKTGYDNELVTVVVSSSGSMTCSASSSPSPTTFTLDGDAASAKVTMKAGHSSSEARRILQDALDSIP